MSESLPPNPVANAMSASEVQPEAAYEDIKAEIKTAAKVAGKQTKTRIAELSPEQRDVLLRRLAQVSRTMQDPVPRLVPHPRGEGLDVPFSFAQEREWFLAQSFPGEARHTIPGALRLEGHLALPALSATFAEMGRRHETLRTNFHVAAGKPVQTIRAPAPLPITMIDLSALDTAAREAGWQRLYAEETRHGFDLAHDHLLRLTLVCLAPKEHLLLFTMHHIIADGWSIGVLLKEMAELYTAFVQSRHPALAELPIQYGDFAIWQRQRLQGGALEAGMSYWRKQLEAPPPVLELAADRIRHAEASADRRALQGKISTLHIGTQLKRDLDKLSRQEDTTLFVTLLSAFMVLLMRHTGRDDLLIGSPVSSRTRVETEGLVGLFLNTLALRVSLSPALTFRQTMATVRQTVLEGLEHADVPFEKVVHEIAPERRASSHPLFEIVFNFTPAPSRLLELPGLRARMVEPPAISAEFAMQLFVMEWEGVLELRLLYQSERYSESLMACFLDQYEAILQQVSREVDCRIGALDLRIPRSHHLLPDPAAAVDHPAQTPVPHSIAAWVARMPQQAALCQGDTTLSYAQLGAAMTALATSLHAAGCEPSQVVAVLGPRSPGVVVAMAATLLAGGVLLTLSPDLPEQRHRVMMAESGARFLLYVGAWRDEDAWLSARPGLTIINVTTHGQLGQHSAAAASDVLQASDIATEPWPLQRYLAQTPRLPTTEGREPAYIFFTSGSTGTPKGVLGTHAGLAHWLSWQRETFNVGPGDRCGQLTGLSFDVVLRDVFLPLTSGATLVLPMENATAASEHTLQWLEDARISLLHTVPSVVGAWLLHPPATVSLASLQRFFCAGEPLSAALVTRWRQAFPQSGDIINLYGPTETTLAKCYYRVPEQPYAGIQPLGTTLPQTQALVLTPERRLCGIGEPGEIALRTPFRSLGYINAPQENARCFIANPFSDDPEDRLYLTGDRGVYRADGVLEFRGRLDHQVKVRGIRVEPTEVAATLQAHPEVASCAVVIREDGADGPALVAYVVPAPGMDDNIVGWQDFLRQRLPAAMVPSAFVCLDSLPLTANQKLDRDRLPAPTDRRPNLDHRYVAPRDATELRLVQLWEELLDVRPIGVMDNFFALGGHSLMALRLLVSIEEQLGQTVPLAALLESPTIAHIAAVARQQPDVGSPVVPLWSAQHRLKLFLIHPGGGILWNYLHLVRYLASPIPVYGLQARGLDGKSEPHQDIERMAADYLEEIRRLQPEGPYLLAGHSQGGVIAFEIARQLHAWGHKVALLALFDSLLPSAAEMEPAVEDERHKDARSLADMVAVIERFVEKTTGVSYDTLRDLTTEEQIDHVIDGLTRTDALPLGTGTEMVCHLLNVSKAHVRASRAFQARVSPVPITLIRAQDAQPGVNVTSDDSLGWSAVSPEPVRVLWTPGDHVTMMNDPHVKSLAQTLRSCLAEVMHMP